MPKEERLHIFTNSYCNNGCLFCSDMRWTNPTTLDVLNKNILEDLKRMRGKMTKVLFSAGEPTLNEKLVDYVDLARKYGYKEIGLITNGRKLKDKKYAEKLLKAGLNEINVSLHGIKKEIHDRITRVPGSFEETFLGLCNLSFLKKKYSFNFFANFLANKINYTNVKPWLDLMLTFEGIDGVVINTVLPKGQAKRYFSKIVPSYQKVANEIVKALKLLESKKRDNHPCIYVLGLPPCLLLGFENHIIDYEAAVARGHRPKDKKKILPAEWEGKKKGPPCKKCRANEKCAGVWSSYVKVRGWDEFKPI